MAHEVNVFLSAMVCGVIAGFVYDLFRLKRKTIKTKALFVSVEDIFFWLFASILVFVTAYISNSGEVRPYFFLAAIFGLVLYFWLLSRWVLQILTILIRVIAWPFLFLIQILKPPMRWLAKIFGEKTKKAKKNIQLTTIKMNRRFKSIGYIYRKI